MQRITKDEVVKHHKLNFLPKHLFKLLAQKYFVIFKTGKKKTQADNVFVGADRVKPWVQLTAHIMWQLLCLTLTEAHLIQTNSSKQQKCQQLHQRPLLEPLAETSPLAACTATNNS